MNVCSLCFAPASRELAQLWSAGECGEGDRDRGPWRADSATAAREGAGIGIERCPGRTAAGRGSDDTAGPVVGRCFKAKTLSGWRNMRARTLAVLVLGLLLAACQTHSPRDPTPSPRGFEIGDVAKADIDMVAEINVRHSLDYLRELARKLYVRNPNQLQRGRYRTHDTALQALFGPRRLTHYPDLAGRRSTAAIALAFDEAYTGDRVAAFIEGMRTMLLDGYGGKARFYVYDNLDPQKLYYLARNFETAFWKLGHDRDPEGRLYLLSNALGGEGDLSFERLAGKLIGLQDHMAQVAAEGSNRQIKNVIQSVASAVFFPI